MMTTNYLNGLIGHLFGKTFNPPSTYYLGLSINEIDNNGGNIKEPPAASGYARIALTNNTNTWTNPANGVVSNKNKIEMKEIKIDSGIAKYWFLSESGTGNAVIFGKLVNDRPFLIDSIAYINPNEFEVGIVNHS